MATVELKATVREARGKGGARKLRQSGRIPAVLYGPEGTRSVSLEQASFELMIRDTSSGNAIFDVRLEGSETEDIKALIKEVQRDPVSDGVIHVDLEHILMTQEVTVQVPVHLTGTAKGVKAGGILEFLLREVEVECLASDIPQEIEVDVTELDRGDTIHVRDLKTEKFAILNPEEQVIVGVVSKAKEEAMAEAAAAEEAGPVVEGESAEESKESKESSEES